MSVFAWISVCKANVWLCVIQGKLYIARNWMLAVVDSQAEQGFQTTETVCLVLPGPKLHPLNVTYTASPWKHLRLLPWERFPWLPCSRGNKVGTVCWPTRNKVRTWHTPWPVPHNACINSHLSFKQCVAHTQRGLLCNRSSCSCQEKNLQVFPEFVKLKDWECGSQGREDEVLLFWEHLLKGLQKQLSVVTFQHLTKSQEYFSVQQRPTYSFVLIDIS